MPSRRWALQMSWVFISTSLRLQRWLNKGYPSLCHIATPLYPTRPRNRTCIRYVDIHIHWRHRYVDVYVFQVFWFLGLLPSPTVQICLLLLRRLSQLCIYSLFSLVVSDYDRIIALATRSTIQFFLPLLVCSLYSDLLVPLTKSNSSGRIRSMSFIIQRDRIYLDEAVQHDNGALSFHPLLHSIITVHAGVQWSLPYVGYCSKYSFIWLVLYLKHFTGVRGIWREIVFIMSTRSSHRCKAGVVLHAVFDALYPFAFAGKDVHERASVKSSNQTFVYSLRLHAYMVYM